MKIEDIQKNILDMDQEELRQLLLKVRSDRRVSKAASRPKAKRERRNNQDKLLDLLGSLSEEEQRAILEGGD